MKFAYKVLLVVIVLVALFLGFYERTTEERKENFNAISNTQDGFASYKTQTIQMKGKAFEMYVADTDQLRAQGLSGKSRLPFGHGMLFSFPEIGVHPFWMPEMKFALDILWVREDKIVEMWENAPVPSGGDIPLYTPRETADIVLEFPAGFAKENGIGVGDNIF